jgi:tRNA A-37 threonylcarbamoyl transferase component Bud32
MRAVLAEHLRSPEGPRVEIVACKVKFTRRGSRSLVQYRVTLRDPLDGETWTQEVSGVTYGEQRTRRTWEQLQRQHPVLPAAGAVLLPAAYVPELDLLLQTFPFDHRLLALESLMAGPLPGLVDCLLARFGPGNWQLEEWQSKPVRYRVDLRASVRITVGATEAATGCAEERRFFAKIYTNVTTPERVRSNLRQVATALGPEHEPLALAPLVAYLPDERVLVQEEVPGVSLHEVLGKSDVAEAVELVRRTARAIAALHRLNVAPLARAKELGRTDPKRLRRSADTLRAARPDLTPAAAEVEAGILAGLAELGEAPSVPIHGDLKPQHVLFNGDDVVLLDLDKFAAGDPMLDVTTMLIFLHRAAPAHQRAFIEEYFAHVPAGWEQRLAPHFAWALLGEASAAFNKSVLGIEAGSRSRRAAMETQVDLLLDEAQAVLAGRA